MAKYFSSQGRGFLPFGQCQGNINNSNNNVSINQNKDKTFAPQVRQDGRPPTLHSSSFPVLSILPNLRLNESYYSEVLAQIQLRTNKGQNSLSSYCNEYE